MDRDRQTIMVVDDNMATLSMARVILKESYEVFTVPSAMKLFELLGKFARKTDGPAGTDGLPGKKGISMPDMILLDVDMPEMNGYDAIKKLKADPVTVDIPVVFLSSRNDEKSELEGLSLGAIDYISKPFSAPLLLKRLENHLKLVSRTGELRIANEELVRAKDMAEEANNSKSHFLAQISHEIRTPMNAIIGMSELMRTDNLDDVQKNYFKDIRQTSHTLLQLINDILDLSKIEAGKMELVPGHFNVRVLFDHLCSMNAFLAAGRELEFRRTFDPALPEVIYGDELRIRQVLSNFLSNAIKYTRQGFIHFSLSKDKRDGRDFIRAEIADSGIGIKPEDFGKVFNTFQQLDTERNHFIKGTGLGLSITKYLSELMGGSVDFSSEYNKGSVFRGWFPLETGDPEKVVRREILDRVTAKDDVSVLVVDDNFVNLTVATGFLATHNIKAETASSGAEAITMIWRRRYDLVFMDHMMPEMDGIETARRIKSGGFTDLPIVALSANAIPEAVEAFKEAGMVDFISKPMEGIQLNRVLGTWLPKNKITFQSAAQNASDHEETALPPDPLYEELFRVEEMNITEGVANVGGSRENFYRALHQFCDHWAGYRESVESFMEHVDWENYAIQVHALKGVFASFGAKELAKIALRLEQSSKARECKPCLEETPAFLSRAEHFVELLAHTSLASHFNVQAGKVKEKGSAELLTEQLCRLKAACIDCSIDETERITAELSCHDWGAADGAVQELCRLAASYDYEETLEKIGVLEKAGVTAIFAAHKERII